VRPVWEVPQVSEGLRDWNRLLDQRLAAGEELIGWKVGFGSQQALASLGVSGPLVGFMTTRTLLSSGASVPIADWSDPLFEPELAAHLGTDLPAGASRSEIGAAIRAVGPAIELVDIDGPLGDLKGLVGRNVCHRHVILGEPDSARAGADLSGLRLSVTNQSGQVAATDDLLGYAGDLIDAVGHVAGWLAAAGRNLQAGHVIIAGSIIPSPHVEPGDRYNYELEPLDRLEVAFTTSGKV
jgi:2-oxo-3-hexenedioate decarboxylase